MTNSIRSTWSVAGDRLLHVVQLPESLNAVLLERFGLQPAEGSPVLGSGDEATVWRVDTDPPVIVRASPATRNLQQLTEAYSAALALAVEVPEVTPPLLSLDGAVVVLWGDRPVSVWPYVEGVFLDWRDPAQRSAAAGLLARLHNAGLRVFRAAYNRQPRGEHLSGLVHGDFYSRNLLCHRRKLVALIDWDDVRIQRLDAELAWATWELAKSSAGDALLYDRAADFISNYIRSGGPARPHEDFIQLIRERLTGELDGDDPDYVEALKRGLRTLDDTWSLRLTDLRGT